MRWNYETLRRSSRTVMELLVVSPTLPAGFTLPLLVDFLLPPCHRVTFSFPLYIYFVFENNKELVNLNPRSLHHLGKHSSCSAPDQLKPLWRPFKLFEFGLIWETKSSSLISTFRVPHFLHYESAFWSCDLYIGATYILKYVHQCLLSILLIPSPASPKFSRNLTSW